MRRSGRCDRIACDKPQISVCKLNGVPEAVFVGVGEEQLPRLAAVGGFVEAGLIAGTAGHNDGGVFVEGLDAAEVEFLCAGWDGAGLPEITAVFGAKDGAVGTAGPGDSSAYVVNTTQAGGGVGLFDVPLGVGLCGCKGEGQEKVTESHLVTSV